MEIANFTYRQDGTCVIAPCLELVAFSKASVADGGQAFAAFYEAFRTRCGDRLTLYKTAGMKRMAAVDDEALDMVPFWFGGGKATPKDDLAFQAHSGAAPQDAAPPAFTMFCERNPRNPNAYFRMVLPADWIGSDPQPFLQLAQEALIDFPLLSGYAGFSFYWRTQDPVMDKAAVQQYKPWLMRHPGFVHGDTMQLAEAALAGVVTADWLTLLGPELVKKLGGPEKLGAAVGPDVTVTPLGKGILLRAGVLPQIGDVNRHDRLPLYQKVAGAVRKVRAPAGAAWIKGLSDDEREEWFARFD